MLAVNEGTAEVDGQVLVRCTQHEPLGCNWLVPTEYEAAARGRCLADSLIRREPDLDDTIAREKLVTTALALRRLVYQLADIGLPVDPYWRRDGVSQQFAIRKGEEHTTIREVVTSPDGTTKTAIAMDGTQYVTRQHNPFADPSKENWYTVDERDKTGQLVSKTNSWRDPATGTNYTCIEWPDGSSFTMSVDSLGNRTVSASTANGRSQALPVELIDEISDRTGAVLSGLDTHLAQGGGIPMVTKDSLDGIHSGVKFAGPALTVGTTVFNMAMAENGVDRCVEAFKGASGAGASAGALWLGGTVGLFTLTAAPITAPVIAGLLAYGAGKGGTALGEFIGSGVCLPTP
jgi:hypothetical protein